MRHRSQAFRTRLRIFGSDPCVDMDVGETGSLVSFCSVEDIALNEMIDGG